jgi:hypothetical protein
MRSVCLFLILANVLYFTWAEFVDLPLDAGSIPRPDETGARHILLASEAAHSESTRPEATNVDPEPPLSTVRADCVSVGPFASLPEATRAAATLSAAGFQFQQRIEQGELWAGYWVYVSELAVPGVADSAIRQLRDRGVTDVFLLPGDNAPVLSLGVFVDPQRAQRRAQIARELGLTVRIVDRKRTGSVYWIDATPTQPRQPLDPAMFPPEPGKIVRIELRPCPEPTGA